MNSEREKQLRKLIEYTPRETLIDEIISLKKKIEVNDKLDIAGIAIVIIGLFIISLTLAYQL